jgi:hypothetical protein
MSTNAERALTKLKCPQHLEHVLAKSADIRSERVVCLIVCFERNDGTAVDPLCMPSKLKCLQNNSGGGGSKFEVCDSQA